MAEKNPQKGAKRTKEGLSAYYKQLSETYGVQRSALP